MTKFIAEVASNHNKDIKRCLEFIDTSAEIGCSAVKFQLFKIEELFAPEILKKSSMHQKRKEWELPVDFLPELYDRCKERDIDLACTPFYLKAVEELYPYVSFYKIASYEILWNDLLAECARTGKPVVISTGMATLEEVKDAVETLTVNGCKDLTLLHCVSSYPTRITECNLAFIETLRKNFNCPVGWSDHSVSEAVLMRAVHRWEASLVEFHLDIDGAGEEFSFGHCWLPNRIKKVIEDVKNGFLADGSSQKILTGNEKEERNWRADPIDGLRPVRGHRR